MALRPRRPSGPCTRQAILDAAWRLFLSQGYHATGMRQIAQETGISLSAAYNHFTSKEEIFISLLTSHNFYSVMSQALSRAQGETVAELMETGFREVMKDLQGKEQYVLLVFIDVLEFQGRHVAGLAEIAIPRMLEFFQKLYLLGNRRGELRPGIEPVVLGRTYLQLIFSSFILENVVTVLGRGDVLGPIAIEDWEHRLIDILLHGILVDRPQKESAG